MSAPSFSSRFSIIIKIGVIGILILLLMIPMSMIESTLNERLERRDESVTEITSSWGGSQQIIGPVLQIPYRIHSKVWRDQADENGKFKNVQVDVEEIAQAFFLPQELRVEGDIQPQKLYRGIYDAVVYGGEVKFSGAFIAPDWSALKIDLKDVVWEDAIVAIGVTDLRGARGKLMLSWADQNFLMTPGTKIDWLTTGVASAIKNMSAKSVTTPFSLSLTFNGSRQLMLAPLGVENVVKLHSTWPDPGFRGAFLPAERTIGADGFNATWKVSYYGRSFPQQWTSKQGPSFEEIQKSLFGVEFVSLIDSYRNVERAIKYGILFLVLIFTAFFLFEIISNLQVHPFQYILVGAALCLFYLALLSISEFLRFGTAYLIAASASWVMISLYSWSVLRSGLRTLIVAGLFALIFGLLYVVLQLQDYALLFGTIGLFAALGAVMLVTRRVDWYGAGAQVVQPLEPPPLSAKPKAE